MSDPDFPEELRSFIQETIPTVDAAELLLLLAAHPAREFDIETLIDEMRPTVFTHAAARACLAQLEARGLIIGTGGARYRYSPASAELDAVVRALTKVYNERPVTLVRIIYGPKDEKIRSFADAFRIKKT